MVFFIQNPRGVYKSQAESAFKGGFYMDGQKITAHFCDFLSVRGGKRGQMERNWPGDSQMGRRHRHG